MLICKCGHKFADHSHTLSHKCMEKFCKCKEYKEKKPNIKMMIQVSQEENSTEDIRNSIQYWKNKLLKEKQI